MLREAMKDPLSAQPEPSQRSQSLILAMLFIATALWLAYEVPAIGSTGQTLGKRLMHIRVGRRGEHRTARLRAGVPALGPARPAGHRCGAAGASGCCFQLIDSASLLFDRTATPEPA